MTIMPVLNVSRRGFLNSSSALVLATCVLPRNNLGASVSTFQPNVYVGIGADGTVTITAHRSEMGQGIRTALAQVIADELDADWDSVVVEQAPGDAKYGDQNTDGSQSIRNFFDPLRQAGATARQMLIQAGAERWEVPISECETNNGKVVHKTSGESATYGELSSSAATLEPPTEAPLKNRADYRYIGKRTTHVDAKGIATGQALYGADVSLPNMAVAVLIRGPSLGARAESVTVPESLEAKPSFIGVETLDPVPGMVLFFSPGGVAVIATDTYSALSAANDIEVQWSKSANDSFNSVAFASQLATKVNDPSTVLNEIGKPDEVLEGSSNVVEATYDTPFLSHAPMEPPVAIADVKDNSIDVWAPVQDPQGTKRTIVQVMRVNPDTVTVTPTLLGGAFGRKSKPDFVLEACELSKRLKRPVRVQWSRENDIQYDYFHAASSQMYKAALGADGMPTAWLQRTSFPTIMSTFAPGATQPGPFELDMGFTNTPYRCANQRFEGDGLRAGVRIGWLRSVCNIFHAFGANVFVDELAERANMDPIDYRLKMWPEKGLLKASSQRIPSPPGHELDYARLRHVLERVRAKSDWDDKRAAGIPLGVAVHFSFYSYVATIVELETKQSSIKPTNVTVALDCGTYVNPDTCIAQMEGAVVFGLSLAQKGKISIANGTVEQSNFDGYQVLRMNEVPDIDVELVESTALPAGVGEPGVPPIAPAYTNAVFAATGKRRRALPISSA